MGNEEKKPVALMIAFVYEENGEKKVKLRIKGDTGVLAIVLDEVLYGLEEE